MALVHVQNHMMPELGQKSLIRIGVVDFMSMASNFGDLAEFWAIYFYFACMEMAIYELQ